jgi:hypothetical protein
LEYDVVAEGENRVSGFVVYFGPKMSGFSAAICAKRLATGLFQLILDLGEGVDDVGT